MTKPDTNMCNLRQLYEKPGRSEEPGWCGNLEKTDCLLEPFQALYKGESGAQGQMLSHVTLMTDMTGEVITEKKCESA